MIRRLVRPAQRLLAELILLVSFVAAPALTQEPAWSVKASAGVLVPTARAALLDLFTRADLGATGLAVGVDLLRQVDCCTELYISGTVPTLSVSLGSTEASRGAGSVSPLLFQAGLNYRLHRRSWTTTRVRQWIYATPFVTATTRGRSQSVTLEYATRESRVVFELPPTIGLGVGVGWRFRMNEQFAIDANAKWQHLQFESGDMGRLRLNPVLISVGVITRQY